MNIYPHMDSVSEAWRVTTAQVRDLKNKEGCLQIMSFCLPSGEKELQIYTMSLNKGREALKKVLGEDIHPRNVKVTYPEFLWVGQTKQGIVVQLKKMPD